MSLKALLESAAPGLRCWLDKDEDATEAGMRRGVQGSKYYLLFLTQVGVGVGVGAAGGEGRPCVGGGGAPAWARVHVEYQEGGTTPVAESQHQGRRPTWARAGWGINPAKHKLLYGPIMRGGATVVAVEQRVGREVL